ncbi:serine-type D-Ala-D-Ala carboxypeptidase [Actinobacillus equuli subsp. haemolyticus]|uniref:serine-type D-Ala-D-Ala carboxypeptidase n=1 Tax=Actinobacillus equuli TaxID=718 RepID=UPI0024428AC5|nr:serine-type D-Ala-D-Ala carboxypeptidase [Actinobacillus equuli]WGE63591.1 serine-type D-Ala-D-Ala carboxypeptidase [Actinobacillus equuli subsp. haemolyticus]WGE73768.1 serine-type D-Ala-D-Ala carboxypeptidase [Actinobacillus equuli subsp. haemolyticus]
MLFKSIGKLLPKLSLVSLLIPSISYAEINTQELLTYLPAGSSATFIAKNLDTNQIIAQYQSDTFMLPASTQKVFTALAAKLALPQDFRFQTALLTNGKVENSVLKGDLIAKFSGDPDLTSGQLYQLISELKKQGITKIDGNLILDTAVFASHDKAAGWIWNDLTMCFSAPPAAVNVDNNCFYVTLDADQAVGEFAKVNVPAAYPVQVFSSAYIVEKAQAPYCQLDVVVNDNNRYQVKGCMARQAEPFGLSFSVQDPASYGANLIKANLKRLGIAFEGKIQEPLNAQNGTLLAEHWSAPLPELLKKMMKKSDNQIADSLFRTIANQQHHRPASFPLASHVVRNLLKSKAGIKFDNSVVVDGSGLSRHNQVSAATMLQALEYIAKNESQLQLFETFPIAGVDGTISGRGSVAAEPLAKNLIAKTGSLKGVYNLAGFMKNARGERIAFVQFVNGYSTGELESKTKRAPLSNFEHKFYMALYNE